MEFHEKLQELRKKRGLTQEELAEALFVSRTAISKWESGRGYPNIDSLKEISKFFSVSIDDLLSGEKVLFIAEKENKKNLKNMCDFLFGIVDICAVLLIILPLYPNVNDNHIYSVNLMDYMQSPSWIRYICWYTFLMLIMCGIVKIVLTQMKKEKGQKWITYSSILISIFALVFLILTRTVYATVVVLLLFVLKGMLLYQMKIK